MGKFSASATKPCSYEHCPNETFQLNFSSSKIAKWSGVSVRLWKQKEEHGSCRRKKENKEMHSAFLYDQCTALSMPLPLFYVSDVKFKTPAGNSCIILKTRTLLAPSVYVQRNWALWRRQFVHAVFRESREFEKVGGNVTKASLHLSSFGEIRFPFIWEMAKDALCSTVVREQYQLTFRLA